MRLLRLRTRRLASRAVYSMALGLAMMMLAAAARADADGPDAWRVVDVAADDSLNVRMGPGTAWPVLGTFGPAARGLQSITCVPLVTDGEWFGMSDAQRHSLPQRWCLVQGASGSPSGWVAARYLAEDGAPIPPGASGTAAQTSQAAAADDGPQKCRGNATRQSEKMRPTLRQNDRAFLQADGYTLPAPDVSQSSAEDYYSKARFPHVGESALWPDSGLDAVTMAMLAFDHAEGVLPHARYRITYHVKRVDDGCNSTPQAFVEVTRFNLGQTRYEEIILYIDQEYWPPQDIFATAAPHVSRRYTATPIMGMAADVGTGSRRLLGTLEAAGMDCLGQPCLALEDASGPGVTWKSGASASAVSDIYREPGYDWAPGPARMAQILFAGVAGDASYIEASEATSLERPDITIVISRDVYGQDSNTNGLLRRQGLMDDAIAEQWLRLRVMPDHPPQLQEHTVYRPGRR